MESILSLKTRIERNPPVIYPSERRYSASLVLGLGIIFLSISLVFLILVSLMIFRMAIMKNSSSEEDVANQQRLVEKSLLGIHGNNLHYYINIPIVVIILTLIVSVTNIAAFCTAILSSKKWYIDQNIILFCLSCGITWFVSAILLTLSTIVSLNIFVKTEINQLSPSVVIFLILLALVDVILSSLAVKVAFKGARNRYPNSNAAQTNNSPKKILESSIEKF